MEDDSKINSETEKDISEDNNVQPENSETDSKPSEDTNVKPEEPDADKPAEDDNTENDSEKNAEPEEANTDIEDSASANEDENVQYAPSSDFENDIEFEDDIDYDEIEKLQAQIRQNMIGEFSDEENSQEDDDVNSVLKKYIVYISKDFVPIFENLSVNEISAYINDAIQKKIDLEEEQKHEFNKNRTLTHIIIAIATIFIATPTLLFGAYKSIMLTFQNYKYSQENFEKLYAQRFKKDKVYVRSLKYNKLHSEEETTQK